MLNCHVFHYRVKYRVKFVILCHVNEDNTSTSPPCAKALTNPFFLEISATFSCTKTLNSLHYNQKYVHKIKLMCKIVLFFQIGENGKVSLLLCTSL